MRDLGLSLVLSVFIFCIVTLAIFVTKYEREEKAINGELYVKCIKDVKLLKMCESLLK